jgi:hypothetical protein
MKIIASICMAIHIEAIKRKVKITIEGEILTKSSLLDDVSDMILI